MGLRRRFRQVFRAVGNVVQDVGNAVSGAAEFANNTLDSIAENTIGQIPGVGGLLEDVVEFGSDVATTPFALAGEGIETGGDAIYHTPQIAENVVNGVGSFFEDLYENTPEVLENIVQGPVNFVRDLIENTPGAVRDVVAGAGNAIGGAVGAVGGAAGNFLGGGGGGGPAFGGPINRTDPAAIQANAADEGIAEIRRQFDILRGLQQPYVDTGVRALTGQGDIIGLNGADAERAAIERIQNGSEFRTLFEEGENAIRQNASATGGLRGGNIQSALGQFRPGVLNQLVNQQYGRLSGLSALGQNAAAGVGNNAAQTGRDIAGLIQDRGAYQAGGIIDQQNQRTSRRNGRLDNLLRIGGLIGGFLL